MSYKYVCFLEFILYNRWTEGCCLSVQQQQITQEQAESQLWDMVVEAVASQSLSSVWAQKGSP